MVVCATVGVKHRAPLVGVFRQIAPSARIAVISSGP